MIIFNGIQQIDKVWFIIFKNDNGSMVKIPLDAITANRISKYLTKISKHEHVERHGDPDYTS